MNLSKAFGLTALFLAVAGAGATYADAATCVPERCLEKRTFFHFFPGKKIVSKELDTTCAGVADHWQNHPQDASPSNASNVYQTNFQAFDHCTNASSIY